MISLDRVITLPALDKLKQKVLYNNTLDVWIALCEEKNWDWYNLDAYDSILNFLKSKNVQLLKASVIDEVGKKGDFLEQATNATGKPLEMHIVRVDASLLSLLRSFQKPLH